MTHASLSGQTDEDREAWSHNATVAAVPTYRHGWRARGNRISKFGWLVIAACGSIVIIIIGTWK